jgi:hypothetical protein
MVRPRALLGAARAQADCAFARNLLEPRRRCMRQSVRDLEEEAEQQVGRGRPQASKGHEAS